MFLLLWLRRYFHIFTSRIDRLSPYWKGVFVDLCCDNPLHFDSFRHSYPTATHHRSYMLIVASFICIVITISPPGAARSVCSLSSLRARRRPGSHNFDHIIAAKYALSPAPVPQYFIYMSPTERGREVGANQDVVRERGKGIRVQLIPRPRRRHSP